MGSFIARLLAVWFSVTCFLLSSSAQEEASSKYIEEIIVTAEKRSEDLQDLSQAVSVLDSDDLLNDSIDSVVELDGLIPGMSIAKNEGFKTVITIRGIGYEASQNSIANPSVSYHMDGVYIASVFSLQTDFLDLERIEVIRGPQGTVFGQNSNGGTINVVSTAPDPTGFSGKLRAVGGNYNHRKLQASINVPINERLAVRASGTINRHDGYAENVVLIQSLDDANASSFKINALWQITPTVSMQAVHATFEEDTNGAAQKGIRDLTSNPRKLAQDSPSEYMYQADLSYVITQVEYPWFVVKSITSLQSGDIIVRRDNDRHTLDRTRPPVPAPAQVDPDRDKPRTLTQEVQLISDETYFDRFNWLIGLFHLSTDVDITFFERIDFGFDGTFDPFTIEQVRNFEFGDFGFISDSNIQRVSNSVYFQGTYHLTESQRYVGGFRYTDDEVEAAVTNFYGRAGTHYLQQSSQRLTGRAVYEIDLNDDTMVYGSLTRGFKPGGSNLTFGREDVIAPILVRPVFEDEVADVLEFGFKTIGLDSRLRLNVALFSYTYENLQYQATDPEVFEGGVANVPESSIRGFEVESSLFFNENVSIDASFAWINSEITASHPSLDNVASDTVTNGLLAQGFALFGPEIQQARAAEIKDVNGNQLPKTPEFNANARVNFEGPLGNWGDYSASLRLIHRGEFYYRIFNNPVTDEIDSYQRIDFSMQLLPSDAPWYLTLNVLNLTDVDGINSRFTDSFGVGSTSEELIPPRLIRVGIGYDF